ncbi:MAG: lysophospholipid acyltransferase family protein [Brachybacterium sp.]|uniref:lysophospholipid acyltransferase family protein n=1 Tax=Brachybacterium sp. TaxID=1891286 RepID=UPI002655A96F|nr:1-acyl-sn-glycerol-3-phosphate acyltransferase [Brachybacterium sp.]MDN6303002.1 1-acyl-sn-glycerol-3-phosphate acyltransferase [Brachybacterium sp.]MDN6328106.1 1-acyl-sn-glycerol-3-phosphate acyltransferase [Brachybacterium sp.]MDN6400516.1 1-acyl-sn-glycerol-3-phosphate acyltransferase [Brachybacterium sp.]
MLYEIAKPVVMAVVRVLWDPTISGTEHIPDRGPVILASNHQAYSDTVFLPGQVLRSVNFLGKSDIFEGRSPVHRLAAAVMRGIRVMPVDRSGGRASRSAIEAGISVLERGEVLGIYPEGTRSPDGRLHRGKTGVARFALATGAPVVPVAMLGAHEAQRGRRWFPRRRPRIHALVGPPVDVQSVLTEYADAEEATILRAVTDTVMDSIHALSGQERVDEYASVAKQRLRIAAGRSPGPGEPDSAA